MDIIEVNRDNIGREHICCALADKKSDVGAASKKAWMQSCFADGYVFKKLNARGKVLIEYVPAENAWSPIEADGYLFIDCFWVSGQFKGQGYANALLNEAIAAAKQQGKLGLAALCTQKKMPFLSDPKYYKYKGFTVADTAQPYYELLYLPFAEHAPVPKFKACAKTGVITEPGLVFYYTDHCPHNAKYIPQIVAAIKARGIPVTVHKIETKVQAQNAPNPFTTYAFYDQGKFVTNEIFGDKKLEKFLESIL
ncbi:GNAT family N-acetyltransferase [Hydrogenoanaerobacterium sp.]|uniref:GNAT family N-acetyltransferase n=1 Tax=Hydrogenoanaerobacterium sp. TaxID=2953763 RepID=UPI00289F0146|nr:GNAT family N-acetyltransferase [Hydrogenoanaerobacterium sp.]